ncbi:MAG: MATE family efflux transporter, partial [Pseudomonadales bacterium]|nr:MATE family efflux transporter [Pseudomonadales bacterium]
PTGPSSGPRFIEGPLSGHLLRLSGFMTMGFLAMTVTMLVEAVFLGLVSKEALAAITFVFPVMMGLSALTRGIGTGASVVLARAMGAGERGRAMLFATHGLSLVFVFTVVVSALLYGNTSAVFNVIGAEGDVLDEVVSYVRIWCIGFPAFGLATSGMLIMRAFGDASFPGWVMTLGALLQMAIGPFLIFGWIGLPAMGIEGAGWAFVIARTFSFVLSAYWFFVRERVMRFDLSTWAASSREILHVGIPASLANLVQPVSTAVTTYLLAAFGVGIVAGFGVASRIESVIFMTIIGVTSSAAPLVGQNWGAKRHQRVVDTLNLCVRYSFVISCTAAVIMWFGAEYFVALINEDLALRETATTYLYIVPIALGFMGMANLAITTFNALSKPGPALVLSVGQTLFYLAIAMLVRDLYGYVGIFLALGLASVTAGPIGWFWIHRVLRKSRGIDDRSQP